MIQVQNTVIHKQSLFSLSHGRELERGGYGVRVVYGEPKESLFNKNGTNLVSVLTNRTYDIPTAYATLQTVGGQLGLLKISDSYYVNPDAIKSVKERLFGYEYGIEYAVEIEYQLSPERKPVTVTYTFGNVSEAQQEAI